MKLRYNKRDYNAYFPDIVSSPTYPSCTEWYASTDIMDVSNIIYQGMESVSR